ncbi:MAG: Transcription-repair-coupling factor, partial [Spartobacteria bacterium]|nr:Transcription-repair-coupling factor [Spartobacteria bacterium]
MEKKSDLLSLVAEAPSIAAKVRQIRNGAVPVAFSHVIDSAQPFLVAAVTREIDKTSWVLCPSVRAAELFYETLVNWLPSALFLPEAEFAAVENILPDPEIAAERLALLLKLDDRNRRHVIVATRVSLDQPAPPPGALQSAALSLRRGKNASMEQILEKLTAAGYLRVPQVTTRGQFAVRGGIVDLYSWQAQLPLRLEFFGDDIESLREFDIDTQTSLRDVANAEILLGAPDEQTGRIREHIAPDHLQVSIEMPELSESSVHITEGWMGQGPEDFSGAFEDCGVGEFAIGDFMLVEAKRSQFIARLDQWRRNNARVVIYFQTEGEIERFRELVGEKNKVLDQIDLVEGTLSRGFCFPEKNLVVLSAAELFGRFAPHAVRRLQRADRLTRHRAQIDFSELNEGDFIVHLEHGVGRFLGLQKFVVGQTPGLPNADAKVAADALAGTGQAPQEVLVLEFADEAKLYVPLEQAYLVSRYVGAGKSSPALSSLADARWARAKRTAAASIFDYAGKMLALQAERETQEGHAF